MLISICKSIQKENSVDFLLKKLKSLHDKKRGGIFAAAKGGGKPEPGSGVR